MGFSIVYFLAGLWQFLAVYVRESGLFPWHWQDLSWCPDLDRWPLPVDNNFIYLVLTGSLLVLASWALFP